MQSCDGYDQAPSAAESGGGRGLRYARTRIRTDADFADFAPFVAFTTGRLAAARFELAALVAFFADRFAFMTVSACVDVP